MRTASEFDWVKATDTMYIWPGDCQEPPRPSNRDTAQASWQAGL